MKNWLEEIRVQQIELSKSIASSVVDELKHDDNFMSSFIGELKEIHKEISPSLIYNQSESGETINRVDVYNMLEEELIEDALICLEEFTDFTAENIFLVDDWELRERILLDWSTDGRDRFYQLISEQTETPKEIVSSIFRNMIKNDQELPILGKLMVDSYFVYLIPNYEMLKLWKKLEDVVKKSYPSNMDEFDPAPSMERPVIDLKE
jgi:hypothetical protein